MRRNRGLLASAGSSASSRASQLWRHAYRYGRWQQQKQLEKAAVAGAKPSRSNEKGVTQHMQ